jgi:hypothetical protein
VENYPDTQGCPQDSSFTFPYATHVVPHVAACFQDLSGNSQYAKLLSMYASFLAIYVTDSSQYLSVIIRVVRGYSPGFDGTWMK